MLRNNLLTYLHTAQHDVIYCRFNASIDKANLLGHTPLHAAARKGHVDIMEVLMEAGADVDVRSPRGHTPLYIAMEAGELASVRLLLASGAKVT